MGSVGQIPHIPESRLCMTLVCFSVKTQKRCVHLLTALVPIHLSPLLGSLLSFKLCFELIVLNLGGQMGMRQKPVDQTHLGLQVLSALCHHEALPSHCTFLGP